MNRGIECLQKDLYSPKKDEDMRLIRVLLVQRDITHDCDFSVIKEFIIFYWCDRFRSIDLELF